jgi:hypothetical protein
LATFVPLDAHTVYGTRWQSPLASLPIAWATVSIIDPRSNFRG